MYLSFYFFLSIYSFNFIYLFFFILFYFIGGGGGGIIGVTQVLCTSAHIPSSIENQKGPNSIPIENQKDKTQ